jgi:hypothetical protein
MDISTSQYDPSIGTDTAFWAKCKKMKIRRNEMAAVIFGKTTSHFDIRLSKR